MDTIEPASISGELLDDTDDDTASVQVVPPVVAVVVTTDPGPWLEESLAALAEQDYPSLSVLVLDNGSAEDLTPRIAGSMPRAFVRRLPEQQGFAAAANDALEAVEGATFLLFCHDDITPDPDAVRLLVEEAYRSNAGIVGPKLVDQEHPEILLEVGMAVDHYGVPYSGIEPDEVDQEQHDGVRDVFFVSDAAMLVRTDLFHELGGFDPATFPGADDVDLCWRARLVGARVVVAPSARVRHRRATPPEARDDRVKRPEVIRAETRSRVRVLFKSYSILALIWVLPVAFVLGIAEAIGLMVTGRFRRGLAVLGGLFAAFAHPNELRRARGRTQKLRRVDDGDVRDLMIRGSARFRVFVTQRMHAGEKIADVSTRTRTRVQEVSTNLRRAPAIIGSLLAVVILFGSRALLFGNVPQVGGFRAWPGLGDAWSTFTGAWRYTFMGASEAASPVFGLMAFVDGALLGHPGLGRSLVVGGALPLGTWGAYRLVRPFAASALPAVAAAVAYAANPIVRNAIWQGEIGPLVCFALAPFVLSALVRPSLNAADTEVPARPRRARIHALLSMALLVAICAAAWPPAIVLALLIGVTFWIASPFAGEFGRATRSLLLAIVATVGAAVLCMPWIFSLFGADSATLGMFPRVPLSLADVLHFQTGRAGAGIASWGIVAAAAVPLAIATGTRLMWAMRAWVLAVASFALVWVPGMIDPDLAVPSPNGVLVGAALGLAFAAGLGVAAILDDLRRFHFGWRQVMTVVATIGLAVAGVGLTADALSGRWGLGTEDWPSRFSWMSDNAPPGGFRVLWVGDATILPAGAKVAGDVGFAVTRDGPGDARALWAASEHAADEVLADAIEAAQAGDTARLGHLLAPAGVRYIAYIDRSAPGSGPRGVPEPRLTAALTRQLDLTLSRVDGDSVVYQNDAWIPMAALVPPDTQTVHVDAADPLVGALRSEPNGVTGVDVDSDTPAGPGTMLWSEAADDGWSARADGNDASRSDAFGWTNAFALDTNAPVDVGYDGSTGIRALRGLVVLLWIGAVIAWFVTRRRRAEEAV